MFSKFLAATAVAVAAALPAAAVTVAPAGTEGYIIKVTSTENIIATYLGGDASFTNVIYYVDGSAEGEILFVRGFTSIGLEKNLGSYAIGTELVFRLASSGYPGEEWYTGPAERNSDGFAHARAGAVGDLVVVSWEDVIGGAPDNDADYNDMSFSLSGVQALPAVPLPAALPLFAGALGGLALMRRRKSKN